MIFLLLCSAAVAETLELPANKEDSIVGSITSIPSDRSKTLLDVAREYHLGYEDIHQANPEVNMWLPEDGKTIRLPNRYILPRERTGFVLNLAELRLFYFPPKENVVMTFPVSVGRFGWGIPHGKTSIVRKDIDPAWSPPASIKKEYEEEGEILPDIIPGGAPNNPLGKYALALGHPGYLIHGVEPRKSFGIGMRVTHGCVRMYPEDIEELFPKVTPGTPVTIINEPIKVGQKEGELYIELNYPADPEDAAHVERESFEQVLAKVKEATKGRTIDASALERIYAAPDGIPHRIEMLPQNDTM